MQFDISPENSQFLQEQLAIGSFKSPEAAVDAAIRLLRRRTEIRDHVLKGCDQLDRGEYLELDEEGLAAFFNSLFGDITGDSDDE